MHRFLHFILCFAILYLSLSVLLVTSQMTLPSMVTIPPDSTPSSSGNGSMPTYAMTIYDQACLDQADTSSSNQSSSSSSSNSSSSSSDDDQISKWVQSQFIVYVGAVALNGNNTCQVICQVQSLTQFSIMFGDDIRTRSVLVGRVYMSSMPDGTSCTAASSNGTCSSGECSADGSSATTEEGGTTVPGASDSTTAASGASDATTVSGASDSTTAVSGASDATTVASDSTTAAANTETTTAGA